MNRWRMARPQDSPLLRGRVYQSLWLEVLLAATGASALMAVLAGVLVLSQSAQLLQQDSEVLQRQLREGLSSHQPLVNLQRRLEQAASARQLDTALVVDQGGVVLAASQPGLRGLPLSRVLQLPRQTPLRQLFADCPSDSALLACLSRDQLQFQGPLPWIGGEALTSRRQYRLALEGSNRFGDLVTLITVIDASKAGPAALQFMVRVFLAGLLPLMAGCVGLMLRLRQRLIPELLRLAQVDALSGVYNRSAFMETAAELLRRARPIHAPVALALVDVDHFKCINDSYGHEAGDQVIRRVSALLRSSMRSVDLVARLGGDEFVILVQLSSEAATAMLERTLAQVGDSDMLLRVDHPVRVTLSAGLASSSGPGGYELSQLMSSADAALYVAKDRGRAQLVNLELEGRGSALPAVARPRPGPWQLHGI